MGGRGVCMRSIWLLTFICLFAAAISAQSTVTLSGTVFLNGQADGGAEISLRSVDYATIEFKTIADEKGKYQFDKITPGVYQISVTRPVKDNQEVSVHPYSREIRILDGKNEAVNINLQSVVPSIRESVLVAADSLQPIDEVS